MKQPLILLFLYHKSATTCQFDSYKAKAKVGNNVARQCCLKFCSFSCRRNIVAKPGNIVDVVLKERAKFDLHHILFEHNVS